MNNSLLSQTCQALDRALRRMIEERAPDGSWKSRFDLCAFPAAFYIVMLRTTGLIDCPGSFHEEISLVRHMLIQSNPDGGFYKFPGSPSSRSGSRVVVYSLRLVLGEIEWGQRPRGWYRRNEELREELESAIRKTLKKAQHYLDRGKFSGLAFNLDHLLFAGLIQSFADENPSFLSATLLPLYFLGLLGLSSRFEWVYHQFNRMTRRMIPAISILYLRNRERRKTKNKRWQERIHRFAQIILNQQNQNGGWFYNAGIPMLNIMALCEAGISNDHPAIILAHEHLRQRIFPTADGGAAINLIDADIWDTCHGVYSYLITSGCNAGEEWIRPSLEYLLNAQARNGGYAWSKEFEKDTDNDSTSFVLASLALAKKNADEALKQKIEQTIQKGLDYLLPRQNRDGGWSVWEKTSVRCRPGSWGYFQQVLFDKSTADQTARVVYALAELDLTLNHESIRRSLDFFLKTQGSDGSWWCRWWAGYISGTNYVLFALARLGIRYGVNPPTNDRLLLHVHNALRKGICFLQQHQNADGGWGETIRADSDPRFAGNGQSTPLHTSFTLSVLLRSGFPADDPAIIRGVGFLLASQTENGYWKNQQAVFTIYARSLYYAYPFLGLTFPLNALNDFLMAASTQSLIEKNC